ncbi:MAG: hypothetical protein KIS94_12250 [Chitinophagales bacterium]|nr:hypothetical protein [Chitinophagales bacterium]
MKKTILPLLIGVLFSTASFAQLSKTEQAKLRNELKSYLKNLEGYKAKKDDIQITIDSNEAQIKRLKDELAYTIINQSEMTNKVAAYENEVKKLREENEELKNWNQTVTASAEPTAPAAEAPPKGTVYKVQIGNYKVFSATKYFEKPRYIGYETVNGSNRYVVSYFTDRKMAFDFAADMKQMGITDAFVAKYVNGKRVEGWGSGQ